MKVDKVARLEVIDDTGRILVKYGIKIQDILIQDNGRTMKIIVKQERDTRY